METNIRLSDSSSLHPDTPKYEHPPSGGYAAAGSYDPEKGAPANNQAPSSLPFLGFASVEYYRPYFSVTSEEVKSRFTAAFFPNRSGDFMINIEKNPDLYGPFWVYTTLIVVMAVAGNIFRSLSWYWQDDETRNASPYRRNRDQVPVDVDLAALGISVIYGFGFVVPLLLVFLLKVFGAPAAYIHGVCGYGYSMAIYIPAAFVASLPIPIIQWLALLYATGHSSAFLMWGYWNDLVKMTEQKRMIVMGFFGFAQLLLLLVLKFQFFAT